MSASIHEIAKASGYSIATVSRVFNQRPNVKDEVRKRILETAKELSYSPRLTARKDCIAIIAECCEPVRMGAYETMLTAALTSSFARSGLRMEIIPFSEIDVFQEKFFEGMISILYHSGHINELAAISRRQNLPLVSINHEMPGIPSVCSNEKQGIGAAVDHLAKFGHNRIALILKAEPTNSQLARINAFRQSMAEHRFECDDSLIAAVPTPDLMLENLIKLLRREVTAIIVPDEDYGIVVSYGLVLLGKKIPAELSLVAYEYAGVSRYCCPAQTTMAQNFEQISERAVALLQSYKLDALARRPDSILVDYTLTERDSVAVCSR